MRLSVLLLTAIAALSLEAQTSERPDCTVEEITGTGFFQLCGTDRDTATAFRDRIAMARRRSGHQLTEGLRAVACDAQELSYDTREAVESSLSTAALDDMDKENQIVALTESGMLSLCRYLHFDGQDFRLSASASERIGRVLDDRNADPRLRALLAWKLGNASMELRRIQRIAHDRSDPIQFDAAMVVTHDLDDVARATLVDDPENVLHAAACASGGTPSPKALRSLCRLALDRRASSDARGLATYMIADHVSQDEECLVCARELLKAANLFTAFDMNSAEIIFDEMPWDSASPFALDFDTSAIADETQRTRLADLLFIRRAHPDGETVVCDHP